MTVAPARPLVRPTCPAWVLQRLHRQGLTGQGHDQTTFSTTGRATPYWHGACGQPVLAGTAWPWAVVLDPTPTTPEGELFAILTGRTTVQLVGRELWRRRTRDLALSNADEVIVLIEHCCAGPPPIPNDIWAPKKRTDSDIIPY